MIKTIKSLSIAEASEYINEGDEIASGLSGFIKKFTKLSPQDAKELRKKIEKMESMKINADNISKIIDIMPENKDDLNKIFSGVNLDEEETKKVLEIIKESKTINSG